MPTLDYLHLDVFTDRRFEGNQLAVMLDGRQVDAKMMQTIAREMNFSETTFLLPKEREDTDIRMRIFTPGVELPMAGHPTIGSTFALAHAGLILPGSSHFVFGLGVGPTRVELSWQGDRLAFAWMDQQLPEVREPAVSVDHIVRAAGVDPQAHASTRLPIQEISCGVPFILLPVASRVSVDSALPDASLLRTLKSSFGRDHIGIYLFTTEKGPDDATVYTRMFGAGLGIGEDPATGSAAGPLGCYLVRHGLVTGDAARKMLNWQGVAMGRPSRIAMAITQDAAGHISRVQVGGTAVVVAKGTLEV
jgi:trans-2,3-dihydro-3-hydroxyanthranilate isomerase